MFLKIRYINILYVTYAKLNTYVSYVALNQEPPGTNRIIETILMALTLKSSRPRETCKC